MRFCATLTLLFCLLPLPIANAQGTKPSSQSQEEKDAAELRSHVLTMDNVTRTYVTMYQIKQAAEKDPNLQKALSADSDDAHGKQTLASITYKYSTYPTLVSIIANNGFTPREFVIAQLTFIQAGMAAMAVKTGTPREKLISEGGVSAANLDFIQQHRAELEELSKKYPIQ